MIREKPDSVTCAVAAETPTFPAAGIQSRKDALEIDIEIDGDVCRKTLLELSPQLCDTRSTLLFVEYDYIIDCRVRCEHAGGHWLDDPCDVNTRPRMLHRVDQWKAVDDIAEPGEQYNAYTRWCLLCHE